MDLNLTTEAVVSSGPPNVKVYGYGTLAVLLICILSILGIVVYPWLPKKLNNMVMSLMGSLAVGALAGDALFHLIPTSLGVHGHDHGKNDDNDAIKKTVVMVSGIYSFYLIDIIMTMLFSNKNVQHSHHHGHHEEAENELPMEILTNDQAQLTTSEIPSNKGHIKKVSKLFGSMKTTKSYGWSVLLADTIHNFADGIAIGAAFSTDLTLGLTTTFAIALHEIPHELGDYAILLQAGFSHIQAVVLNFLTAFTSLIGLYVGITISSSSEKALPYILSYTAGVFLYIALTDILPLIIPTRNSSILMVVLYNLGILTGFVLMFLIAFFEEEIYHLLE
ncbi:hypothetical protein ACOME3_005594 [Neoechinorhynchus agilis]